MTISASDIKFRKPERLTDFDDGGGRMIWAEVEDGVVNNLFPDVDPGDRVYGRVSMRPLFVHVATNNTDILTQAILALVERPADPNVSVVMFATGNGADVRSQAKARIETFRMPANESPYILYGNHNAGTQVLSVFGRVGMADPEIGDVLVLSVEASGYTARQEAVKVESILSHTTETFSDANGEFERDVLLIALTRPITAAAGAFVGMNPARNYSTRPPTLIRATRANESAQFFGTQPLAEDIVATPESKAYVVKVPSIYQPLVPANSQPEPLVDVPAGQGVVSYIESGAAGALSLSFNASISAGGQVVRYLGMGFAPGTLTINAGSATLIDDGHGGITVPTGDPPTLYSGVLDYDTGRVALSHSAGVGTTSFALSAQPAAGVTQQSYTFEIPITLNNQSPVQIAQLRPRPAAGTVLVDYRANGEWIRLRDDGAGGLAAAPGQGSGTINYATGSVSVSLPALPDVDSSIIFYWGTPITAQRRDGDVEIQPPAITYTVAEPGIAPGSLEITYLVSATPVVLTDNGAGIVLDDATPVGTVNYSTGEINFTPATLPDSSSQISTQYDSCTFHSEAFTPTVAGGTVSFTLANAPIEPGSVHITWPAQITAYMPGGSQVLNTRQIFVGVRDNGAGLLQPQSSVFTGTIDYATGAVTLDVEDTAPLWVPTYEPHVSNSGRVTMRVSGYEQRSGGWWFAAGTTVTAKYAEDSPTGSAQDEDIALPPVTLNLIPSVVDTVTPGSVRFAFRGRTYVDRAGLLVHSVDPATNAATTGGSIDYATGKAAISDWAAGGANTVSVSSLLTTLTNPGVGAVFFRAPGSPLQPGSFTLSAVRLEDSVEITATSDINGNITGTGVEGHIDWQSGVVSVYFGAWVVAAGNEGEWWYDADNINDDGDIWKPMQVLASEIVCSFVLVKYTTVSATRLGLDPIMLPNDGRVVVFRPGVDLLLIDERETVAADPEANDVVNLGRTKLSQIEVRDNAGTPVDSEWYTLDLDAGTVTFADPVPVDWLPWELPLRIRHRVVARKGVTQARITGQITLNQGIDRNFDAATTLVCAAINLGEAYGSPDVQARIGKFFDQQSDEIGIFKDEVVGNPATATYNRSAYPIELTNRGAITERWKLRFQNSTEFVVIGESEASGQLPGVFSTSADCAPINPQTITLSNPSGDPFFVVRAGGWGAGWATGNIVRMNTIGADPKVWMVRVTQPSDPSGLPQDQVRAQVFGGD